MDANKKYRKYFSILWVMISPHLSIAINAMFYIQYSEPTYSIILIINWLSLLVAGVCICKK